MFSLAISDDNWDGGGIYSLFGLKAKRNYVTEHTGNYFLAIRLKM
jgi:hypothetical protein